ncbi:hypothetical protein [Rubrolithibacter danxiaensis]|uniref:hypothetical protein n=1 Tax=Rubrolithibacter danxiaensis TaxID=3390805 RepID=UPI003BF78C09
MNKEFTGLFGIYFFYLCISTANPLSPTIYHGLAGIIIHLAFWLVLFIYISNREAFNHKIFFKFVFILIIAESILAIIQYKLPAGSYLNRYATEEASTATTNVAAVGNAIRVTGSFSYLSGFTGFMLFFQLFTFALLYSMKRPYVPFIILSVLGLVLSFISGSRAAVFLYIILYTSFLVFQVSYNQIKRIVPPILISTLLLVLLNIGLGDPLKFSDFIVEAYTNFSTRVETSGTESDGRIWGPVTIIFSNNFPNWFWGNGLGIGYQGVNSIFGTSRIALKYGTEDEIRRTIIEGGYILLFFKLILIYFAVNYLSLNKIFSAIMLIFIFIYVPLSSNAYNAIFLLLGLIYLDKAIYQSRVIKLPLVN